MTSHSYYATSTLKQSVCPDKCIELIMPGILSPQGESLDTTAYLLYSSNRDLRVIPSPLLLAIFSSPVKKSKKKVKRNYQFLLNDSSRGGQSIPESCQDILHFPKSHFWSNPRSRKYPSRPWCNQNRVWWNDVGVWEPIFFIYILELVHTWQMCILWFTNFLYESW